MSKSIIVTPSVRSLKDLDQAMKLDNTEFILLAETHIGSLKSISDRCHKNNKKVMVNFDLIKGLSNDNTAISLLEKMFHVDAVIDSNLYNLSRMSGQKFKKIHKIILKDSRSIETGLRAISNSRADMIELSPALYGIEYIDQFRQEIDAPFILSGFVCSEDMIDRAAEKGFYSVTTSNPLLWR